jgi:hypothetical protein
MAPNIDFTEAKLSTVLDGLIALVDTPPAVSRSLNLIVYAVAVPLDPPEDDPDAEPQFRQLMMANDKRGSLYDRVGAFVCSDDGKLWAGIASEDVHWLVVNHEKKGQLGAGRPFVSPDGTAYACTQTVKEGESDYPKTRVSIGDQPGPAFQTVEAAGFSARGIFAYAAFDAGQFGVIVGGEPMGPYGDVAELVWSPDGGRLAFVVGDPAKFERSVVLDSKRGPSSLDVRGLRFSPDSTRLAYVASEREGERVVVDGKAGARYSQCLPVQFSADSRTVIGRVGIEKGWAVAVNDRAGKVYDEVGPPVFSGDAKTVAYGARRGEKWCVVIGEAESEWCDHVYRVAVGAQAGVAYALLQGKSCTLVHNGREVYRNGPRPNHLAISADGASIAYSESKDGKVRILVNGEAGPEFQSVDKLGFAPDGRTPVYLAQEGEAQFIVVGRRKHGPMVPLTDPVFNAAGDQLAVVARIGREFWRKILPVEK